MANSETETGDSKRHRRPGKPRRGETVVTPAVLERIASMWLQGVSEAKTAAALGVSRATIRHHLDAKIIPLWRERMRSQLDVDLAKVHLIEQTAWERFDSAEPSETRESVEKALLDGGREPRLVRQAVQKVTRVGELGWLQVIQWCLDFRARVHGYYAPARHTRDLGGELRVAGMTPVQVDEAMLKRLHEKILERREYQQGLEFRSS